MRENFEFLLSVYERHIGNGHIIILFALSLLYFFYKKKNFERNYLAFPIILIILLFAINPLAFSVIEIFLGANTYWRTYWLLFEVIVVAIVATELVFTTPKNNRMLIIVSFCFVIFLSGDLLLQHDDGKFQSAENLYKISDETIEIADILIANNITRNERVFAHQDIAVEIRQYNTDIRLVAGRQFFVAGNVAEETVVFCENANIINNMLFNKTIEFNDTNLHDALKTTSCKYLVIENSNEITSDLSQLNWISAVATTTYNIIFKINFNR